MPFANGDRVVLVEDFVSGARALPCGSTGTVTWHSADPDYAPVRFDAYADTWLVAKLRPVLP